MVTKNEKHLLELMKDNDVPEELLPESLKCPVCGRSLMFWTEVRTHPACRIVIEFTAFCEASSGASQKYWNDYRKGKIHTPENKVRYKIARTYKYNLLSQEVTLGSGPE